MKAFAELYMRLDATTSSTAKLKALRDYFNTARLWMPPGRCTSWQVAAPPTGAYTRATGAGRQVGGAA